MKKFLSVKSVLFALALVLFASFAMNASQVWAEENDEPGTATLVYVPEKDAIKNKGTGTAYVYLLKKKDAGQKVKAPIEIAKDEVVDIVETFKVKPDKDLFVYVSNKEIEKKEGERSITAPAANFIVKATKYKKLVIYPDYTAADAGTGSMVSKIVGTPTDKTQKPEDIYSKYADVDNGSASLADKRDAEPSEATWQYSEDGTEWKNGKKLLASVVAEPKTLYFRNLGAAVDGEITENVRTTKTFKLKFAATPKEKKVKIDVKKLTIAAKNGYEYAVKPESDSTPLSWKTILPYNKASKNETEVMDFDNYIPVDKKDTRYSNFTTKTKVKALSIPEFDDIKTKDVTVVVRTAATTKKPASASVELKIEAMKGSPIVKDNDDEVTAAATLLAYNTSLEFNMVDIANAEGDESAAVYEMAVINVADWDDVDWDTVAWKKVKPAAKKAIKASTKTKYNADGKKKEASLAKPADVVIAIRRAGVKNGAIASKLLLLDVETVTGDNAKYYILKFNAKNVDYAPETAPTHTEAYTTKIDPDPVTPPEE